MMKLIVLTSAPVYHVEIYTECVSHPAVGTVTFSVERLCSDKWLVSRSIRE